MLSTSSFDTIYERVYPAHLRLTPTEQEQDTEKHKALRIHFENIGQTLTDLVLAVDDLFPGKNREKAIDLFHEDLLRIAEKLICSNSPILLVAAINIASQLVCHNDRVTRTTEIFFRFQEQYEARLIELERQLRSEEDDIAHITCAIEQGFGFKTLHEKWSEFLSETVASFLSSTSVIPLNAKGADNFHQMAICQLTQIAEFHIPTYQDVIDQCSAVCLEPEDFPAGVKIVGQSYTSVISGSEAAIKNCFETRGLEKAISLTREYLWLDAGMIMSFHAIPSIKMRAISAFCQHRHYLELLHRGAAFELLGEIRDYYVETVKDKNCLSSLEMLLKLTPDAPSKKPSIWFITNSYNNHDLDPRVRILMQHKKLRRDSLAYVH